MSTSTLNKSTNVSMETVGLNREELEKNLDKFTTFFINSTLSLSLLVAAGMFLVAPGQPLAHLFSSCGA